MFDEDFERKVINIYDSKLLRFLKRLGYFAILIIVVIYFLSGIYIVGPDEVGMIKTFGSFTRKTPPGIHYKLPYPFETLQKPKITEVRRAEVGFRTISPGPPPRYQLFPQESLMLTGDENIVDCQFIIQYRISDPYLYLFQVKDPGNAVQSAAESAMREVVGKKPIDDVLTTGRSEVQEEVKNLLQEILDKYQCGIQIIGVQLQDVQPPQPVISAFKDVASAREDRVRFINQAEAYRNEVIPQARGEAEKLLREAEAFKESTIKSAEGETQRFLKVLKEYQQAPEVTRKRIYLETLQKIWPKARKFIFDSETEGRGILKFLPLTGEGMGSSDD